MTTIARLLHAAGVLALAGAIIAVFFLVLWLIGVLADGRKLRNEARKCHERRVEDAERAKLMGDEFDSTRFYDTDYKGPEARA